MTITSSGRELLFSPDDIVKSRLLQIVGDAKRYVYIQAYTITMEAMVDTLIELKRAERDIRIIVSGDPDNGGNYRKATVNRLDQIQDKQLARFKAADVPYMVGLSRMGGIMHGKYILVDGMLVAHGSYNFTASAEWQGNHVCIDRDAETIRAFEKCFADNWQRLQEP